MAGPVDTAITYKFLKKLTTPFNKMPAYKFGLIDGMGNFKKNRAQFTPDEKNILGMYDVLIINLKKLINKLPGGSSRLGTIAAAMFLLKTRPIGEDLTFEQIELLVENEYFKVYNNIVNIFEDINANAPVNSAGSGSIAGIGVGRDPEPGISSLKYKNKSFQFKKAKLFSHTEQTVVQGAQDTVGIQTKKSTSSPKTVEIIHVQNKVVESLSEDISLQYHKQLNSKLWDTVGELKEDVKNKLLQIADAWIAFAKIPSVLVYDIVITGGNVNYNYTQHSDIDLHIVMSRSAINPDRNFVDEYLQDKKILWSLQHPDISIYGYPVELYAQDIDEKPHANQGVYSIVQNRWIARPQMLDLNFEDDYHLQKKVQFYKDMIDKTIDGSASDGTIDILKDKIKKMRGDSIAKEGEFAFGNLIFKELRNAGYIDKLNDYKKTSQDKFLSLGRP